jgi:hypothetical protein
MLAIPILPSPWQLLYVPHDAPDTNFDPQLP